MLKVSTIPSIEKKRGKANLFFDIRFGGISQLVHQTTQLSPIYLYVATEFLTKEKICSNLALH
jgi:hypothetical protein